MDMPLITFTDRGMHCAAADVYIDPWRPVQRAIITHAHSDHARPGMGSYLCHEHSAPLLRHRLGSGIAVEGIPYGERRVINGVTFSLHPAGHVIGSAQVRVEHRGEVWVASGDYKVENDGLTPPFEAVRCNTFITECTFGVPVYIWQPQAVIFEEINAWWRANASEGICTVLSAYSLGKAQRIMANVDTSIGPILTHGAVEGCNAAIREAGIELPETIPLTRETDPALIKGALVIAPGSAVDTPWANKLRPYSSGIASGWMQVRGWRRRSAVDRGFALSDHADWPGLNAAVRASGAERVITTHGYTDLFSRWLNEQGIASHTEKTAFKGEEVLAATDEESTA
ncbi:MAG: ligase-associated DNA damage response exonuclease [Flavobacteriales bacterium]|nr:ligase-associated DNA damage response exonuclease [Flavobacteriales bacterium]